MLGRGVCALLAAVMLFGTAVQADDLVPAPWRTNPIGKAPTTFQIWEFGTDANPVTPDEFYNSYGSPQAEVHNVSLGFPAYTEWLNDDPFFSGRQGIWKIDAHAGSFILLDLPNAQEQNPVKKIWLQITYSNGNGAPPIIQTQPPSASMSLENRISLADGFYHDTFLITIEPNPDFEQVALLPRYCNLYVDEIVVETICIPEPATLGFLALGSVALLRRKK